MKLVRDRDEIERFLRRDPFLHIYELGDLDEDWRSATEWYGVYEKNRLAALALLFTGLSTPTLLALSRDSLPAMEELLRRLGPKLPERFYAHLSPGLSGALKGHRLAAHGAHNKMSWLHPERLAGVDCREAAPLTEADAEEVRRFLDESYPGNWFVPQALRTGRYFGVRRQGRLVAAAGTHVNSPRYRVAALGNIATHPDFRGQGLAKIVTAAVCRNLLATADHIGLNVKAGNAAAIACYRSLGFEIHASYEEFAAAGQSRPD
ncbi:MAG: GNAT family N-acetyltransferase [Elusimicrobia bacterium]|nr:GNAT family N-acetyltransferase [Elusimicrobiota bacterium]